MRRLELKNNKIKIDSKEYNVDKELYEAIVELNNEVEQLEKLCVVTTNINRRYDKMRKEVISYLESHSCQEYLHHSKIEYVLKLLRKVL